MSSGRGFRGIADKGIRLLLSKAEVSYLFQQKAFLR